MVLENSLNSINHFFCEIFVCDILAKIFGAPISSLTKGWSKTLAKGSTKNFPNLDFPKGFQREALPRTLGQLCWIFSQNLWGTHKKRTLIMESWICFEKKSGKKGKMSNNLENKSSGKKSGKKRKNENLMKPDEI